MNAGCRLLMELNTREIVTAEKLGITDVVMRTRIKRLREKGIEIYGYRGRGYSLKRQLLPTAREQEVLDMLKDGTVWCKEDIAFRLYGDSRSAENISCIITRLRKRGYRIINRQKRGYLLV